MAEQKSTKHRRNFLDLTGKTFNRLTVARWHVQQNGHSLWECICICGSTVYATTQAIKAGNTKSCGCLKRELAKLRAKHGMSTSPEFVSWQAAKNRCFNPAAEDYALYGGRGISMCSEWRESFQVFLDHVGRRPEGRSLDRIDTDKGYEPGNVRWATQKTQCRNKRNNAVYTHNGETLTLMEWSERTGIPYTTLKSRLKSGVTMLYRGDLRRHGSDGRFH